MKKTLTLLAGILCSNFGNAQTIVWQNDFETASEWGLNVATGMNDTYANEWAISDTEGGVAVPGCGVATNGNKTLHVTSNSIFGSGLGAAYFTGIPSTLDAATNKRTAFNSNINLTGQTNMIVTFDYIAGGQANTDYGTVLYSIDAGASWLTLSVISAGTLCGGGQGQWANFSIALPVGAEGQNDVRIAFNWQNNNDGAGSDPSLAINNLKITTPSTPAPVAAFSSSQSTICMTSSVTMTNTSTNSPTSYLWSVTPATFTVTSGSLTSATPSFSFSAAGLYTITLVATNGGGSSPSVNNTVQVNDCGSITENVNAPSIALSPNPNEGNFTLDLTKLNTNLLSIELLNYEGKLIYATDNVNISLNKLLPIDVSHIESGLYFVRLNFDNQHQEIKFIKR